jgi:hypothetical protein
MYVTKQVQSIQSATREDEFETLHEVEKRVFLSHIYVNATLI